MLLLSLALAMTPQTAPDYNAEAYCVLEEMHVERGAQAVSGDGAAKICQDRLHWTDEETLRSFCVATYLLKMREELARGQSLGLTEAMVEDVAGTLTPAQTAEFGWDPRAIPKMSDATMLIVRTAFKSRGIADQNLTEGFKIVNWRAMTINAGNAFMALRSADAR